MLLRSSTSPGKLFIFWGIKKSGQKFFSENCNHSAGKKESYGLVLERDNRRGALNFCINTSVATRKTNFQTSPPHQISPPHVLSHRPMLKSPNRLNASKAHLDCSKSLAGNPVPVLRLQGAFPTLLTGAQKVNDHIEPFPLAYRKPVFTIELPAGLGKIFELDVSRGPVGWGSKGLEAASARGKKPPRNREPSSLKIQSHSRQAAGVTPRSAALLGEERAYPNPVDFTSRVPFQQIGPLSSGRQSFRFLSPLSNAFKPLPCSPGIVGRGTMTGQCEEEKNSSEDSGAQQSPDDVQEGDHQAKEAQPKVQRRQTQVPDYKEDYGPWMLAIRKERRGQRGTGYRNQGTFDRRNTQTQQFTTEAGNIETSSRYAALILMLARTKRVIRHHQPGSTQ
nr:hypothetical protein Iba_chr08dCG10550 [Ipomoea batatas]